MAVLPVACQDKMKEKKSSGIEDVNHHEIPGEK